MIHRLAHTCMLGRLDYAGPQGLVAMYLLYVAIKGSKVLTATCLHEYSF